MSGPARFEPRVLFTSRNGDECYVLGTAVGVRCSADSDGELSVAFDTIRDLVAKLDIAVKQADVWKESVTVQHARIVELTTERDAAESDLSRARACLDNVSGALVDTGTVSVGDETTYADGVRALTAERERNHQTIAMLEEAYKQNTEIADSAMTERDALLARAERAESYLRDVSPLLHSMANDDRSPKLDAILAAAETPAGGEGSVIPSPRRK